MNQFKQLDLIGIKHSAAHREMQPFNFNAPQTWKYLHAVIISKNHLVCLSIKCLQIKILNKIP